MSGTQNGVQAIFQKEVPKALYTYCYNYRLNLVIVDVCKNVPEIEKFISILQQLYNFISRSTVHMAFLSIQKELFPKKNTVELKKLCDTRWICQISACIAVRETFSVILVLLNKISIESIKMRINQIKIVSDYLQLPESDLELPISENREIMSKNDVRTIIFFPVIDRMINELQRRFSDNNPILSGISSLNPQNKSFLDLQVSLPFAKHYEVDIESLESELKLIPKLIDRHQKEKKTKTNTILDFIQLLENYKLAFFELYLLFTIAIIIPPSSAGVERTFSSLRQIKTFMRSKMINTRLSDLAVLSIEKNISKNLDLEFIVDKFSAAHHNRRIMLV
ncbi:uncharacterized protein LOC126907178 [Daktulosphaira vitifoliae]|uniref:uncharacterized protein LOC126907178 n=1 Tax=Daktulosphaira vitifoliae TaxID=58002 RepID=UPI0021AA2504|nr:uncharacterized protein LOC126907178 [Daktulosphaira vitifoliae]